jgi:hypothetical protein
MYNPVLTVLSGSALSSMRHCAIAGNGDRHLGRPRALALFPRLAHYPLCVHLSSADPTEMRKATVRCVGRSDHADSLRLKPGFSGPARRARVKSR